MTTCRVHNVRFFKPHARTVHCMAYSEESSKLAIARDDSTIEIWDLRSTAHIERTIPAVPGGSIEGLAWYKNRLFSTGLHGIVVEYDLFTLSIKYEVSVTSGPSWCIDIHKAKKLLAVGTEDGYINIFEIDNTSFIFLKLLDKQEGRILCLKWDVSGRMIATGSVDSVRLWNVKTGHAIHRMTSGRKVKNQETIVWCIMITEDLTVVTGDSRGCVTFWSSETGTQLQKLQTLVADVLCMAISQNGETIYCSGVDPVIAVIKRTNDTKGPFWMREVTRNIHSHDVRSMVVSRDRLFSAGVDGYLSMSYYPRVLVRYAPFLQPPFITVCVKSRCIMMRHPLHLEVWQLGKVASTVDDDAEGFLRLETEPTNLFQVTTKNSEQIVCATMSSDSQWFAYSTQTLVRFFRHTVGDEGPCIERLHGHMDGCGPVHAMRFLPNSSSLVVASNARQFHVVELSHTACSIVHTFSPYTEQLLKDTVFLMTFSPNGKYFVAADHLSNIAVWDTDNWSHYCSLPNTGCAPTAMEIQSVTNNLVVVYADQRIVEFCLSPDEMKYTDFSRRLGAQHPHQWLDRSFVVTHVTFDPRNPHVIIVHDDNTVLVVDKRKQLAHSAAKIPRIDSSSDNQRRMDNEQFTRLDKKAPDPNNAFHFIKKYKHLVYLGWLKNKEMVAVEVSPLVFEENLPATIKKKVFGTS